MQRRAIQSRRFIEPVDMHDPRLVVHGLVTMTVCCVGWAAYALGVYCGIL